MSLMPFVENTKQMLQYLRDKKILEEVYNAMHQGALKLNYIKQSYIDKTDVQLRQTNKQI